MYCRHWKTLLSLIGLLCRPSAGCITGGLILPSTPGTAPILPHIQWVGCRPTPHPTSRIRGTANNQYPQQHILNLSLNNVFSFTSPYPADLETLSLSFLDSSFFSLGCPPGLKLVSFHCSLQLNYTIKNILCQYLCCTFRWQKAYKEWSAGIVKNTHKTGLPGLFRPEK